MTQQLTMYPTPAPVQAPPKKAGKCPARVDRRGVRECIKPAGHDGLHHARWAMRTGEAYWQDEPAQRQGKADP